MRTVAVKASTRMLLPLLLLNIRERSPLHRIAARRRVEIAGAAYA